MTGMLVQFGWRRMRRLFLSIPSFGSAPLIYAWSIFSRTSLGMVLSEKGNAMSWQWHPDARNGFADRAPNKHDYCS